jgi:hypothetical protein
MAVRRIAMVYGKRAQRNGGRLELSPDEHRLSLVCRTLHHRFLSRKYEASEREVDEMLALAELLVVAHKQNTHGVAPGPIAGRDEPSRSFDIDRAALILKTETELPATAYAEIVAAIQGGAIDGGNPDAMIGGEQ